MAAMFIAAGGWKPSLQAASSHKRVSGGGRRRVESLCKQRQLDRRTIVLQNGWIGNRRNAHGMAVQHGAQKRLQMEVIAGFEELAHNQVLFSSVAAGISGQLTKPLSSSLSGKGFNWKLVTKSGGMPSSHSAFVTAAATALAFERGLSDGVFGLSVVLAGIVMYDAQTSLPPSMPFQRLEGVRNAVGKQAKVINTMVLTHMPMPHFQTANTSLAPSPSAIGSELASGPVKAELAFMENVNSPSSTPTASSATATMFKGEGHPSEACGLAETPVENASSDTSDLPATFTKGATKGASNEAYIRPSRFFERAVQLPSMREGQVDLQELGSQDGGVICH